MGGLRGLVAAIVVGVVGACGAGDEQAGQMSTATSGLGSLSSAAGSVVELPPLRSSAPGSSAASATSGVELDTRRPQLVAFDAVDGQIRWTREVDKATFGLTMSGGHVIETGAGAFCGETAARVRGIDVGSGEVVWSVDYRQPYLAAGPRIAVADGVVVFTDTSGLIAVDALDGVERWRKAVPTGPIAAGAGLVLTASDVTTLPSGRVDALTLDDGSPVWSSTGLPAMQVLDLLWTGDVAVASGFTGDMSGGAASIPTYALDGSTGAVRWTSPGFLAGGTGDLVVTHRGRSSPEMVGLDSTSGVERWRVPGDQVAVSSAGVVTSLLGPVPATPPADGSMPMVSSSLTARSPANGSELWTAEALLAVLVDELAVLVREDLTMEAVGVTDGQPRWQVLWPSDSSPPGAGLNVGTGDGNVIVILLAGTDPDAQPGGCD
jgi:outer membrane protein assembly factor BamB